MVLFTKLSGAQLKVDFILHMKIIFWSLGSSSICIRGARGNRGKKTQRKCCLVVTGNHLCKAQLTTEKVSLSDVGKSIGLPAYFSHMSEFIQLTV